MWNPVVFVIATVPSLHHFLLPPSYTDRNIIIFCLLPLSLSFPPHHVPLAFRVDSLHATLHAIQLRRSLCPGYIRHWPLAQGLHGARVPPGSCTAGGRRERRSGWGRGCLPGSDGKHLLHSDVLLCAALLLLQPLHAPHAALSSSYFHLFRCHLSRVTSCFCRAHCHAPRIWALSCTPRLEIYMASSHPLPYRMQGCRR